MFELLPRLGLAGLVAIAYPTVRYNGELDRTFAGLPPGVQATLGLGSGSLLTSPVGYLNGQYFANLLPILFLVFGIGLAAVAVAAALAVVGFLIEGLAAQVKILRPVREASSWHWLLGSDPLRGGLTWHAWALPAAVSLVLVLVGIAVFARRDMG